MSAAPGKVLHYVRHAAPGAAIELSRLSIGSTSTTDSLTDEGALRLALDLLSAYNDNARAANAVRAGHQPDGGR